MTHGSLTLIIDPTFRPEHNARQWGIMESDYPQLNLKAGEKVYVHYLAFSRKPQIPPDKWLVPKQNIYCVIRDNKIVPLNGYIFVNILKERDKAENIVTLDKKSTSHGIVEAADHRQLSPGDEILFKPLGAFENEIEGKSYYVMESEELLAKIVTNGK